MARRRRPTGPTSRTLATSSPPRRRPRSATTRCSTSGWRSPSHRQARTYLPPADECPLCPSRDGPPTEIPSPDYDVVVFENRFPSFATGRRSGLDAAASRPRPGNGRCEVVCFTSDHDSSFSRLSPERGAHGRSRPGPTAPPRCPRCRASSRCSASRTAARRSASRSPTRTARSTATRSSPRGRAAMLEPPAATASAPAATCSLTCWPPSWPTGRASYARTSTGWRSCRSPPAGRSRCTSTRTGRCPTCRRSPTSERDDFAGIYLDVLQRMDAPLRRAAALHRRLAPGAGARSTATSAYLHLELFSIRRAAGKLKYLAGSESAMGAFVNDMLPEQAAACCATRCRVDDRMTRRSPTPSPTYDDAPDGRLVAPRAGST